MSKFAPGDKIQTKYIYQENVKNVVKIDHFCSFSDIIGVYYELNEHIDMNHLKSCQASSDTSLEYQQGVVWLKMAHSSSKMAQKGQKWLKMANF